MNDLLFESAEYVNYVNRYDVSGLKWFRSDVDMIPRTFIDIAASVAGL